MDTFEKIPVVITFFILGMIAGIEFEKRTSPNNERLKDEAIKAGVAEYVHTDKNSPKVEFRWVTNYNK